MDTEENSTATSTEDQKQVPHGNRPGRQPKTPRPAATVCVLPLTSS